MKEYLLKEIANVKNGYAFDSSKYSDKGIPIIRIADIKDNIDLSKCVCIDEEINKEFLIKKGSLLIALSGATTGKMSVFSDNKIAYLNQRICSIYTKNEDISQEFLIYFLKSIQKKIIVNSYGGAQPNISSKWIENIKIKVPNIEIQKKISKKLELLANSINSRKSQLVFLKELTKSLFTTMFGDIKTNDKNWETRKIEDCTLNNVKNIDLKTIGEITYIDISSINNKENIISSYKKYDNIREAPSRAKKILNENDILISTVRPALKNIAIFNKKNSGLTIGSTGFCVLRPKDTIDSKYIFEIIKSNNFTETLIKKQIGANYPAVSDRDIKSIKIPVPPIELQNKFAERIEKIEKLKFEIEKSIEVAQNLYDSLISKYFDN